MACNLEKIIYICNINKKLLKMTIDDRQMLPIGTLLKQGEYRVVRYIASGGFGNTYEVEHVRLGKRLALKEFFMRGINMREGTRVSVSLEDNRSTFSQMREKFYKEAQRLARLEELHIVDVTDFFEENATAYYVMKLIDGESLAAKMKRTEHPFGEDEVRNVLPQVLSALRTVHAQTIYHLDIKPGNIVQNGQGFCWLIDFGASKQLSAQESQTLSTSTGLCYTPGYAPSEQISGSIKRIGPWTDFYALGATVYNLLTNQAPPEVDDVKYDGEAAFHFPPYISGDMRQLVLWLMQADYRQRPQSVKDIEQQIAEMQAPAPGPVIQEALQNPTIPKVSTPEPVVPEVHTPEQVVPEVLTPDPVISDDDSSEDTVPDYKTYLAEIGELDEDDADNSLSNKIKKLWVWGVAAGVIAIGFFFLLKLLETKPTDPIMMPTNTIGEPVSEQRPHILSGYQDEKGKYGFVDETGNVAIPCRWKDIRFFNEGLAAVMDDNEKWGFIDETGEVVIPCQWKETWMFREDLAVVKDDKGKYGYIDKSGQVVLPCQWNDAYPFCDGLAAVENNNIRFGYINKSGDLVIRYKWFIAGNFNEGLAYVADDFFDYGYIDTTGKLVIQCNWKDAWNFSEGLAAVKNKKGKWGFIDKSGELVIPCQWKEVGSFINGIAHVKDADDKDHIIDKTGITIDN